MYQRVLTHIVTLLFAAAVLVPRVANLHALSHSAEDDISISCELCDILVHSNQLDLITGDNSYIKDELENIACTDVKIALYNTPQEKIATPKFVYNKPPPLS